MPSHGLVAASGSALKAVLSQRVSITGQVVRRMEHGTQSVSLQRVPMICQAQPPWQPVTSS